MGRGKWLFGIVATIALAAASLVGAGSAHAQLPVTYNFFAGIPSELTNPGGSLPGSNDFSCRPSAEHPNPVVLAHGTGGSQQTNWGTYVPLLKNEGYCVFAVTYGAPDAPWPISVIGGMGSMETSAEEFGSFVRRVLAATGAEQVDVVGHSQGTMVPAYFAKFLGGADTIGAQISIAPAWGGSRTAAADQIMDFWRGLGIKAEDLPLCQACGQIDANAPFMKKLREGGYYLPGITYTNIATRYDEAVVPYTLGLPPGGDNVTNIVVQDGCEVDYTEHAGVAGSRRAATFVLNALDPANPRPVPCDRAAPFTGSAF